MTDTRRPEPRWPSFVAVVAVSGLSFALHEDLLVGPRWLSLAVVVALLIPTLIAHQIGRHDLDRFLGFFISVVLTIGLIASVILPSDRCQHTDSRLSR